jgi:hypothetical protein
MNNNEFLKWFAFGVVVCATWFMYGFIKAWVTDVIETQQALDEIKGYNHFPRVKNYPQMIKRFAAIHNARILDMLDLGIEQDNGDHYFYLHVTQPGLACNDMLVRTNGENVVLLRHEENRVSRALISRCNLYVHDTQLDQMVIMFANRIMNSDTAPATGASPWGTYSKTTLDSEGRIVFDKTSGESED